MPHHSILLSLLLMIFIAGCSDQQGMDGANKEVVPQEAISRTASLSAICSGCHGNTDAAIVALSGYSTDNLITALMAYKSDTSGSTVMHRLMRGYSDEDIASISAYLSGSGGD